MGREHQILILCELKNSADLIAHLLRRQGIDVQTALNAEEALHRLKKSPFDMVISHVRLREGSGVAFMIEARKESPLTQRVLLENDSLEIEGAAASWINAAGICAVLQPPLEPDLVLRLLALEGAVSHEATEAETAQFRMQAEKVLRRNKQLEEESQLLEQEVLNLQRRNDRLMASMEEKPSGGGRPQTDSSKKRASGDSGSGASERAKATRLAASLSSAIGRIMEDPEVILPVLPPLGLEIQRMAADEDCSFSELAQAIEQEQSLSARLLHMANSPLYAGLERTRNLQQAVSRLGLHETRNIVQAVLVENMFRTRSPALMKFMARLWFHSLCCAYSNENIALTLQLPQSEDFFVMGLLHDLGKLLVMDLLSKSLKKGEIEAEDLQEDIVLSLMDAFHHDYGAKLLEKWGYSKGFVEVVRFHNDDENIQERSEAVIVTYFSNLLARKIGYSLVPYEEDRQAGRQAAEALNMTSGTSLLLEKNLREAIEKIKKSFFGSGK